MQGQDYDEYNDEHNDDDNHQHHGSAHADRHQHHMPNTWPVLGMLRQDHVRFQHYDDTRA